LNLLGQKKLASKILKVGKNRIRIDPNRIDEVELAITRQEIRKLIAENVIIVLPEKSQSYGRTRILKKKKKSGRRIGPGSKKGSKNAVVSRKKRWMYRIRSLRKKLRDMKERRIISVQTYRSLYRKAKGGEFRSIREMDRYINEHDLRRRTFG
jgi:large subunit ribosomal protein L19e